MKVEQNCPAQKQKKLIMDFPPCQTIKVCSIYIHSLTQVCKWWSVGWSVVQAIVGIWKQTPSLLSDPGLWFGLYKFFWFLRDMRKQEDSLFNLLHLLLFIALCTESGHSFLDSFGQGISYYSCPLSSATRQCWWPPNFSMSFSNTVLMLGLNIRKGKKKMLPLLFAFYSSSE